jgi:transcriptional regulator with XRE-family HTH domain
MTSVFGHRLRQFREAKKLTLQQVADAVGCTKAYIWELEMRAGQRPSAERLNAIAKTLGVTLQDLLGEPVGSVVNPTPVDVAFFRDYVGMDEDKRQRYRDAMRLMFGDPPTDRADKS